MNSPASKGRAASPRRPFPTALDACPSRTARSAVPGGDLDAPDPAPGPMSASGPTERPPEILHFGDQEHDFVTLRARRMLREGKLTPCQLLEYEDLPDPAITAIIPARNEAGTIAAVVRECRHYAAHIIVVEGGSTDATAEIALAAGARVLHDEGRGKGAALRFAVAHATTPICVFVDADGSHDPIDIPQLAAPIKSGAADHVTGSRLRGGSDELHGGGDEFLRLTGSAFITTLINWRYGTRLSDSQNGFRAIRTDVFRALALRSLHITIEMEMIMATLAAGYRMAEVPTHELPRAAGFSKVSLANPAIWLSYGGRLLAGLCRPKSRRTAV